MELVDKVTMVLCLLLLLQEPVDSNHCSAAILKGPSQLLEETTGGTAAFTCTVFGATDPRTQSSRPCRYLFNTGNFNPVRIFWNIQAPGLDLSLLQGDLQMIFSTSDLLPQLRNKGVIISTNCLSRIFFDDYRRQAEERLASEPADFCLNELSCSGTIAIPVNSVANNTKVTCGVYSTECREDPSNLENDEVFVSNEGRLVVRESLLHIQVSTSPGAVCVQCFFTYNSTAVGCHVKIRPRSFARKMVAFNVSVIDDLARSCTRGLDNDTYTVTAVEIDARGMIGTRDIIEVIYVERETEIDKMWPTVSNNVTVAVDVPVVAGLLGGVALLLLVTIAVGSVLVRRKCAKTLGSSLSSDQIRGYSNHSNRATPVEELYDTLSTPTHEYEYPSEHNGSYDYASESYDARLNSRPTTGHNSDSEYESRRPVSYVNVDKHQHINGNMFSKTRSLPGSSQLASSPIYGNVNEISNTGYLVILPDSYPIGTSTGEAEIFTKKCVAYSTGEAEIFTKKCVAYI